ncbi:hypothetical protein BJX66DRAFT_32065 [Aspergillus keveii]|uniref:Uncharacterized protein n=1 Tax=Aspergillus keveii TaxID=714993 RepID=A0ABR4FTP5_9EURO
MDVFSLFSVPDKKRRRSEDDGNTKPEHRIKRRPIMLNTVDLDSDEGNSSPEDGTILYSDQREPLQASDRIPSSETGRSAYERQQNIPTQLTTLPTKSTQPAAGLPAKSPCPASTPPVATESENRSRLTEEAMTRFQSQKSNARNPDQVDTSTSPDYNIPSPLTNELALEIKITEVCQRLSDLFEAAFTQQKNLREQMDDLRRSQETLEELITKQKKRTEDLRALVEEKVAGMPIPRRSLAELRHN